MTLSTLRTFCTITKYSAIVPGIGFILWYAKNEQPLYFYAGSLFTMCSAFAYIGDIQCDIHEQQLQLTNLEQKLRILTINQE